VLLQKGEKRHHSERSERKEENQTGPAWHFVAGKEEGGKTAKPRFSRAKLCQRGKRSLKKRGSPGEDAG